MSPELTKLLSCIVEAPEDWTLRMITADCAEEAGDIWLAECLRWMSKNKHRAFYIGGRYYWYNVKYKYANRGDEESDLPTILLDAIKPEAAPFFQGIKDYLFGFTSRSNSENAIYAGWKTLREKGMSIEEITKVVPLKTDTDPLEEID